MTGSVIIYWNNYILWLSEFFKFKVIPTYFFIENSPINQLPQQYIRRLAIAELHQFLNLDDLIQLL